MKAIVIHDVLGSIAKGGKQIVTIPEDLQWFKGLTNGHTLIMGRKTADAIGHPLSDRTNIVITRNPRYGETHPGFSTRTLQSVLFDDSLKDAFVIGGETICRQLFNYIDTIYGTVVVDVIRGDKFFPPMDGRVWDIDKEVDLTRIFTHDGMNYYHYKLIRKSSRRNR